VLEKKIRRGKFSGPGGLGAMQRGFFRSKASGKRLSYNPIRGPEVLGERGAGLQGALSGPRFRGLEVTGGPYHSNTPWEATRKGRL